MNDPQQAADPRDRTGQVLGPYRVIRLLGAGGMGRVYLAEDTAEGRQVALKVLNDDIVRERTARVRFLREAQSAAAVLHASVAAVYAIHEAQDAVFIAMEYVEGRTLRAFLDGQRGPLELREALRIARDVAHALCHAHAAGVVHRDLKPENLMLDLRGQVKILDFGLAKHGSAAPSSDVEQASTLSFATADGIILGTPSYMAPEQIHGKPTDARADIFSVGVVLYEMAAGARPFRGASTMEVLIATARDELRPASAHNPQVTPELDALLARCLAKAPVDRFASAEELAAALDELLLAEVEVELHGAVPGGNARGYLGEILPPRFLRGRDRETGALLDAAARAREGGAHLMLVHGDAGVGKSALLSSVRDPIGRSGARFVSGKFDRNAQGAPLAPLAQALGALFRQISGDPDVERWRAELSEATGPNRHVLDDMVPELRRQLGPAPAAPADAAEAENRFHAAFQRIIRLFAARTPPLVLALDDLHCADPAALHLIELILSDPAGGNLLVLASYRDAELGDAHPLRLTQDRLHRLGVAVHELALQPLHADEVAQLVADALGSPQGDVALLAARLDAQARGNPAMLRHLLLGLRREGQLNFDSQSGRWRWDEASPMTSSGSAGSIAAFLAARLQRLPDGVQRVLAIIALAGRPIELALLSAVDRRGLLETTHDLREALREGLLVPSDSALHTLQQNPAAARPGAARTTYQPLHDGIAQAAALLLPADARAELHLQLGRNLLRQPNLDDDDLFALVDHLDRGMTRMSDPAECERLARLHLEACRRARIATAYAAAVRHARAGLLALAAITPEPDEKPAEPERAPEVHDALWRRYPAHTFKLLREWMHAEASRGELAAADALFDPLVLHASSELERADLYRLKAQLDTYHGRPNDAIAAALAGLYRLGVELLPRPEPAEIEAEHLALTRLLAAEDLAARVAGPVGTDPRISAISELLAAIGPAAMFADARLGYQVFIRLVRLFIEHGPTRNTAYGLAGYGLYLAGARHDLARASEFGRLALQMRERFADPTLGARILHIVGGLITGWTQPFAVAATLLEQGYAIGVQTGDFAAATYNTTTLVLVLVARRHSLTAARATAEQLLVEARPMLEVYGSSIIRGAIRMCRCLAGELQGPTELPASRWLSEVYLRELERDSSPLTLLYLHIYAICTLYHFGRHDPDELPRLPAPAAERLGALVTPMTVDYFFYNILHACAAHPPGSTPAPRLRAAIESHIAELRNLAAACPANFEARAHLAAAEYERICGRDDVAESAFKLAIRAARRQGEAGTEALACELAGRHCVHIGDDIVGAMYLRAAVEAYQRWGAHAVARRLAASLGLDPQRP